MRVIHHRKQPIGVGIVGLGRFGEFLLTAYTEMEEVQVLGVFDADLARAQALVPRGVQVYKKFEDLLNDPRVEIVVIATPPFLHASMAIQALQAGKHVLVEKPLATSIEEAQAVIKTAHEQGVFLTVDYVLRFHPLHQLALRLVREGFFGDLHLFSLINLATDEGLTSDHWFWDVTKSGGIHVEHGVHFFDLCNQLVGYPPSFVQGYLLSYTQGRVDGAVAVVGYGEKILATFYHSFTRPRCIEQTTIHLALARGMIVLEGWIPVRLKLYGLVDTKRMTLLQDLLGRAPNVLGHHGSWVQIQAELSCPARQEEYKRALQALIRDFIRAVKENSRPLVTPEDAIASLAIAIQATKSAFGAG